MTNNFALWDTEKNEVIDYPRNDNEPVVNLNPRYLVLKIVEEEKPDDVEGFIVRKKLTVDLDAGEWRHGWELVELEQTPVPTKPNYLGFYLAFLESGIYRDLIQVPATPELVRGLTVFLLTIQNALNYRVNLQEIQNAISLLIKQPEVTNEHLVELKEIMSTYHLNTIYTLEK